MKRLALSSAILSVLFCCCALAADAPPPPDTLTLKDLTNHPERWPADVSVNRDLQFKNGFVLHSGDKAHVVNFDGAHVYLVAAGNNKLMLGPDDCTLVDSANQAWTALTPAQRAVDPASIAADPSLWPATVKTNQDINSRFGKIPADTEVSVTSITPQGPAFIVPKTDKLISIDYRACDGIDRARQLALLDHDKRPSPVAHALENIMVDADGKPFHDDQLADKKIFAFYYGANWCNPCHLFSPTLVSFAKDQMPKHSDLAVVFLSKDNEPAQMFTYMKTVNMPFPAVTRDNWTNYPLLTKVSAEIMPQFTVVDRFGKVLASNDDLKGNRGDPEDTVAQLTKMLAAQPAQ